MLTWSDVLRLAEAGNQQPDRRVEKTEAEWQSLLSAEQFQVTRRAGTERPFSHPSCQRFEPGIYQCVCCGEYLFDAREKFDSGTGWPSFTQPIKPNAIAYHADRSHGMIRIEVTCSCCDAHLGHVFPDGPAPSGLRYCINGVALKKVANNSETTSHPASSTGSAPASRLAQVTLGGGCFWCTEAIFQRVRGVQRVESGYSGGSVPDPDYHQVCSGSTGHAECVQVTYDPAIITFESLVAIHLCTHDPTTLNRQGADCGTQYRSIIFYSAPEERMMAQQIIEQIEKAIGKSVVTELQPLDHFYAAEDYHQNYYNRNRHQGYCSAVIDPKLAHLRKAFAPLLVEG